MADLILRPFANAGTRRVPAQTDENFNVNFEQGYTPQYEIDLNSGDPNAKAVERPIMNYLFYLATSNIQSWQKNAFPEFYPTMPGGYGKNTHVYYEGKVFRSLIFGNTKVPGTDKTAWEEQITQAEILAAAPMPYGGSAGPSAAVIATSVDFNELSRTTFIIPSWDIFVGCQNRPPVINQAGAIVESLIVVDSANNSLKSGMQRVETFSGEVWTRSFNKSTTATDWELQVSSRQVQNNAFNYASATGPANDYAANMVPPVKAYQAGQKFTLVFDNATVTNTGPATININGLGRVNINSMKGTSLVPGIIKAGVIAEIMILSSSACYLTSIIGLSVANYQGEVPLAALAMGIEHALVPIGVPMPIPTSVLPSNYLKGNGQSFSATVFPELAKVYPNLKVPDLRACGLRGLDEGRGIDINRQILTEQADSIRSHAHTGSTQQAGGHVHAAYVTTYGEHTHTGSTTTNGNHQHGGSTNAAGDHQHYSGWGEAPNVARGPWGDDGSWSHAGSRATDWDNAWWLTSPNGNHAHSFATTWNGDHAHSFTTTTVGSGHGHTIGMDQAGIHVHTFTTDAFGAAETVNRNVSVIWAVRAK